MGGQILRTIKQYSQRSPEALRYLIAGGLTTLVCLAVYMLCVYTFLDPEIAWQLQAANVISWICAVSFAYVVNRHFVFRSTSSALLKEAASFFTARIGTLVVEMGLMHLLVTVLGLNDKVMKVIVQVIVIVLNYVLSKLFVFGRRKK